MALNHTAKLDPTNSSMESLNFNVNYTVAYLRAQMKERHLIKIFLLSQSILSDRYCSAIALPFYKLALTLSVSPFGVCKPIYKLPSHRINLCDHFLLRHRDLSLRQNRVCAKPDVQRVFFCFTLCNHIVGSAIAGLTLVASLFFIYKSLHNNPFFICSYFGAPKKATGETWDNRL